MEMTHPGGTLRQTPAGVPVAGRGLVSGELAAGTSAGVPMGAAPGSSNMRLADLATGAEARVVSVSSPDPSGSLDLGRRLAELGFLPGEKLRIVARGLMGREPLAVRIGTGTFALRLFEAACVRVCPEQSLLR
jgi:ferrous iron transport protein A